jgi:hypothetical protein
MKSAIEQSTVTSFFPLMLFADDFAVGTPAWNWINLPKLVVGLMDFRPRAGTFHTPWQAKSGFHLSMPDLARNESRSLDELMDLRAGELYAESKIQNKKIMIMWSGGIDSTSIIVSMLRVIPHNEIKDVLVICMTVDSVLENLYFYKKFISNQILTVHKDQVEVNNEFFCSYILLHGDPGDALFLPSTPKYAHLIKENLHQASYKKNRNLLYNCFRNIKAVPEQTVKWYVDKIIDNIEEVNPPNVDSIADFFWWHYMNLKWEGSFWYPFHTINHRKNYDSTIDKSHSLSYIRNTFFNTDYFHQWSCTNLKNLLPGDVNTHKQHIKQYIYNFDQNQSYFTHKQKVASLPLHYNHLTEINFLDRPFYYDTNWTGYTLKNQDLRNTVFELLNQYTG